MSPLASAVELAERATYTITTEYEYGYTRWQRRLIIIYLIVLLGIAALTAIGALGALIVWYFRERKRKQLYGPMAQYYRDRGFGRTGMVGYNGAMYVPQVVYVPFGGQPGVPQPPPGPIVGVPMPVPGSMPYGQNPQFQQVPQFPQSPQVPQNLQNQFMTPGTQQQQPQLQPINTSVAYNRGFDHVYGVVSGSGSGNGNGSGNGVASGSGTGAGDIAAGMSQRDIEGPTSPIRDFNGSGAHDPFASPHIHSYSNLPPQAESSSRGAQMHGITEVHGQGAQGAQMSEKGDVGLTRASNTLSFYTSSIPVGSQTNVNAAAGPGPSAGSGAGGKY